MPRSHTSEDSDSSPSASRSSSGDESLAIAGKMQRTDPNPDPESPNAAHQSSDETGSSDGVLVELPSNNDQDSRSLQGEPDSGVMVNIDGSMQEHREREDLFVDASDHVGRTPKLGESAAMGEVGETSRRRRSKEQDLERLQARLDASTAECRKYKEEREVFGREVVNLRADLLDLIDQQFLNREELVEYFHRLENRQQEHDDLSSPNSLQSMVKDCSRFVVHLKGVLDDRLNTDVALINTKDQEIEVLNSKLLEYDVFRDVLISYLGAVKGDCSLTMHEYITPIKNRLLAAIPALNGSESVSSSSSKEFLDDISLIEKRTMLLLERHNMLSVEVERLGQFVEEIRPGYLATQTNESGSVFTIVQQMLHENKKKEEELEERIGELEEQNMKMDEQIAGLNKDKEDADTEMSKIRTELEQSESRALAAKEKLSIAVTKGKQLVQHRDSLKQSLSDKTAELDKCLHELKQKTNALETLEARTEELTQLLQEKASELDECLLELRLKSDAFNMEYRNSEELKQLLAENKDQLENCLLDLQQKSKDLQSFTEKNCELEKCLFDIKRNSDALKQALAEKDIELEKSLFELQEKTFFAMNIQSLVRSLQDLASSRDKALKDIEESTSDIDFPEDMISLDAVDKIRWLVTKTCISDQILQENQRAKDAFSSIGAPEAVSFTEFGSQAEWLVRSFTQSKDEVSKLQSKLKEVEIMEESLLKEKEEKESLLIELEELKVDHKKFAENLEVISSEKERFLEFLEVVTETKLDDQLSVDMDAMLEKSIVYLRKKLKLSLNDHRKLENMQKLLHVTYVEVTLFKNIVEELLMDGLKMTSLSDELGTALNELYALKNEKESMKKELERLEEKNSLIRDKLSMAVKKGKGLVQEREGFKLTLAEKSSEIEKLKEDLQLQESKICEYWEQIKSLSAYPEHVQKLEVEITSLKDEKEENEQLLNESNETLKKIVDSINNIAVHTDKNFEAPIEKVEWIAGRITEREIANANLEQELEKVKIDADLNSNKLAEALETLKSLEMDLHNKEEHIHDLYDEKNIIEVSKTKVEEVLEKAREESFMQASKLADACAAMKSLEDELSSAEDKVSALESEKNRILSENNLEITALNVKLAELMEVLSKSQGNSETQSTELLSELKKLQIFMRNEGLFCLMIQQFHNKAEDLKHVWMLVHDIHDNLMAKGLHIHPEMEKNPAFASLSSLPCFEDFIKNESFLTEAVLEDTGAVTCQKIIQKIYEEARFANDRFTSLSKHMDDYIKLTLEALQAAKDEFIRLLRVGESLNLNIKSLEARNQSQEFEISSLQKEATRLLSACNDATQELRDKIPDFLFLDSKLEDFPSGIGEAAKMDVSYFAHAADNLSLTCRKVITQSQNLAKTDKEMSVSIENLKHKLSHAELTAETAINERKLIQERVLKLESDMKGLQSVCNEMEGKLNGYRSKEDLINEKEAELKRLELSLTAEDRGAGDVIIPKDQAEVLINKVNELIARAGSSAQSDSLSQEVFFSSPIDKLFYVVDKFSEFQKEVYSLTCDNENLRKSSEFISVDLHDFELMKSELSELTIILEKITQKFARSYTIKDVKPVTVIELLGALEKQMIAMNEDLENCKSELRELGVELRIKDEIVDELSGKIKYLEDSLVQIQQPIVKERSAFESSSGMPRPEITEIEEAGPVGISSKPPAASAHVRTTRKGSNEHLVLNIHSESEQLITSHETDEKGHVFKSLNTSGLIPKHGRLIADRVDGIWVSGGRILMSKPGARLGLIGYWIFLHLWLLGTIL